MVLKMSNSFSIGAGVPARVDVAGTEVGHEQLIAAEYV